MRRGHGEGGGHPGSRRCPCPRCSCPLLVVPAPLVLIPLVRQGGGGGVTIAVMSTQGRGGVVAVVPVRLVILVVSVPLIVLVALVPSVVMAGVTTIVVVVACD